MDGGYLTLIQLIFKCYEQHKIIFSFKSLKKSTIILLGRHSGSPGIIALVNRMCHFISKHEIRKSGVADRIISFNFPLISVACDGNIRLGVIV